MKSQICTLCGGEGAGKLFSKKDVVYYSCAVCGLVFMDPAHWPSREVELERYSEHNNDGNDPGYVKHLMDIGERVVKHLEGDVSRREEMRFSQEGPSRRSCGAMDCRQIWDDNPGER
jgi:hypothetical protein